MEIERKYLVTSLPEDLRSFPSTVIEQAYICREPVIRVRHAGDAYILTVKGRGKMVREEFELPLTEQSFSDLLKKAEGNVIRKRRYFIPYPPYTVELDIFEEPFDDLMMAEVEFPSVEEADAFAAPEWFGTEVTQDARFQNSNMSAAAFPDGKFRY